MQQRLFVFGSALCLALGAQGADSYATYTNVRFGYSVLYPTNLVTPRPEAPNSDGRVFKSRDGRVTLSVWGQHNAFNRTLQGQMNFARGEWAKDRGRVTYSKIGRGFYVLSGFTGGQIFYEKTVANGDGFATMLWQYPQTQKPRVDPALVRTTRSFKSGGGVFYEPQPAPRPHPKRGRPAQKAPTGDSGY